MNYMHPSRDDKVLAIAGRRNIPAEKLEDVRLALRNLFEQVQPVAVVASAAAGADLLALEEARHLELDRYVVLPFAPAEFRAKSVSDMGEQWDASFDLLMKELEPECCTILRQNNLTDDAAYAAINGLILDCATAMAREGRTLAVRIWEGKSRGPDDFTDAFGAEAIRRGLAVRDILYT